MYSGSSIKEISDAFPVFGYSDPNTGIDYQGPRSTHILFYKVI